MSCCVWFSKGTHTAGKHTETLSGPRGSGTGNSAGKWRDFTFTFCSSYKMLINHLVKDHLKSEIHKNGSPSSRFMKSETKVKTFHCNGVLIGSFPRPPFTPKSRNGSPLRGCAQGGRKLDHSHGEGSVVTTRLLFVQLAGEGVIFNFGAWKLVWVPWERERAEARLKTPLTLWPSSL